jgi:hypothetical protein
MTGVKKPANVKGLVQVLEHGSSGTLLDILPKNGEQPDDLTQLLLPVCVAALGAAPPPGAGKIFGTTWIEKSAMAQLVRSVDKLGRPTAALVLIQAFAQEVRKFHVAARHKDKAKAHAASQTDLPTGAKPLTMYASDVIAFKDAQQKRGVPEDEQISRSQRDDDLCRAKHGVSRSQRSNDCGTGTLAAEWAAAYLRGLGPDAAAWVQEPLYPRPALLVVGQSGEMEGFVPAPVVVHTESSYAELLQSLSLS